MGLWLLSRQWELIPSNGKEKVVFWQPLATAYCESFATRQEGHGGELKMGVLTLAGASVVAAVPCRCLAGIQGGADIPPASLRRAVGHRGAFFQPDQGSRWPGAASGQKTPAPLDAGDSGSLVSSRRHSRSAESENAHRANNNLVSAYEQAGRFLTTTGNPAAKIQSATEKM